MRISSIAERLSDTQEVDGAEPSSSTMAYSLKEEQHPYIVRTTGQYRLGRPACVAQQ